MAKDINFDKIIKRKNTNSVKYDDLLNKFGTTDLLPLWVADMDFATSPAIIEAIQRRLSHHIFGYSFYNTEYFDAIKEWYNLQHDCTIEPQEIVPVSNIASAIAVIIEQFSTIGDKIIIQTPIYPPFREIINRHERVISENKLLLKDGKYEIDWNDFSAKAKDAKIFLLCSPHNPTGRVWWRYELKKIAEICRKNNVIIISDEIHGDLTHIGYKHIPMFDVEPNISITLNSPAKRFNIPSLVNAYAIIKDKKLKNIFENAVYKYAPYTISPISTEATIAAYQKSREWINGIDKYLANNLAFIKDNINNISQIKIIAPEASFLLWLDCRGLNMSSKELSNIFVNKLKLGLNNGSDFGIEGDGFMRLNYAMPMSVIIEAMNRLKHIYN